MPILQKQFQAGVVEHLSSLAELAREDEAFLEALVRERVARVAEVKSGSVRILVRELVERQREEKSFNAEYAEEEGTEDAEKRVAIASRMVRHIVECVKPRGGQLGVEHVRTVLELAGRGENGKRLLVPGGVEVRREHDALIFCAGDLGRVAGGRKAVEFERAIKFDGRKADIGVPELSCVFRFRVIDWPVKRGDTIEKELALDFDAMQAPLLLRNWRPGDRLRPCGHRNAHKLKRLLSEKRVSGREREGWPVVTSGGMLVWARGFNVAAEFAANEKTRKVLVISEDAIS
jgi:tRNA(Ile)-lysidine synthase